MKYIKTKPWFFVCSPTTWYRIFPHPYWGLSIRIYTHDDPQRGPCSQYCSPIIWLWGHHPMMTPPPLNLVVVCVGFEYLSRGGTPQKNKWTYLLAREVRWWCQWRLEVWPFGLFKNPSTHQCFPFLLLTPPHRHSDMTSNPIVTHMPTCKSLLYIVRGSFMGQKHFPEKHQCRSSFEREGRALCVSTLLVGHVQF